MTLLPIAIAAALVIAAGAAHGLWVGRWSAKGEMAPAPLEAIPATFGDWSGTPFEVQREQLEIGEVASYLYRRYDNRKTGESVSVLVVCGRPGPISVHTPDICYAGAGYEVIRGPARHPLPLPGPSAPAEFLELDLRKARSAVPEHLRIFYGWTATGSWTVPDNPRLAFAREPVLYKAYFVRETRSPDQPVASDPALDLAAHVCASIERLLEGRPRERGAGPAPRRSAATLATRDEDG